MDNRLCVIVGSCGQARLEGLCREDIYIMACDGGLRLLGGIVPDLAVGDFDSLGYIPDDLPVLFHKPEKDDTDVMLAVRRGLEMGFRRFALYGCMGGRIDHAFANYQVLGYILSQGGQGYLTGDGWMVSMIRDGSMTISGRAGDTFSVFAYGGKAHGVTISGGKYPLDGYEATPDFPIGVSNQFMGGDVLISVKNGSLLLMWQGDRMNWPI